MAGCRTHDPPVASHFSHNHLPKYAHEVYPCHLHTMSMKDNCALHTAMALIAWNPL